MLKYIKFLSLTLLFINLNAQDKIEIEEKKMKMSQGVQNGLSIFIPASNQKLPESSPSNRSVAPTRSVSGLFMGGGRGFRVKASFRVFRGRRVGDGRRRNAAPDSPRTPHLGTRTAKSSISLGQMRTT